MEKDCLGFYNAVTVAHWNKVYTACGVDTVGYYLSELCTSKEIRVQEVFSMLFH